MCLNYSYFKSNFYETKKKNTKIHTHTHIETFSHARSHVKGFYWGSDPIEWQFNLSAIQLRCRSNYVDTIKATQLVTQTNTCRYLASWIYCDRDSTWMLDRFLSLLYPAFGMCPLCNTLAWASEDEKWFDGASQSSKATLSHNFDVLILHLCNLSSRVEVLGVVSDLIWKRHNTTLAIFSCSYRHPVEHTF